MTDGSSSLDLGVNRLWKWNVDVQSWESFDNSRSKDESEFRSLWCVFATRLQLLKVRVIAILDQLSDYIVCNPLE
jgi:hypothetical protein